MIWGETDIRVTTKVLKIPILTLTCPANVHVANSLDEHRSISLLLWPVENINNNEVTIKVLKKKTQTSNARKESIGKWEDINKE